MRHITLIPTNLDDLQLTQLTASVVQLRENLPQSRSIMTLGMKISDHRVAIRFQNHRNFWPSHRHVNTL